MKQLLVHCEQTATKVALLENGRLSEYYVEKPNEEQAGCIYKGRVVNVLPGMQAAFVDIGQARNAFLYVDDLLQANLEKQPAVKPAISDLVKEGQQLLVQIVRESSGSKGAKVTTHYSIPGRYLVYMPNADYIGISRKIESDEERARLKEIGEQLRYQGEGIILRTVAEGALEAELERDLSELREIWSNVLRRSEQADPPACVYRDLAMVPRLIRDLFTEQVDELIIDNEKKREEITAYVRQFAPALTDRIMGYHEPVPMLYYYGIADALEKALRPKVWLDNGGYLIIDQTEALTVIDVNTGKFTGSVDLEQTVFETNLLAAEEIARLIRLRDIGGIIIIDFIDMAREEHQTAVLERVESVTRMDRTKTIVMGWTQLGLLEITRKKVRSEQGKLGYEVCPCCGGSGKRYLL